MQMQIDGQEASLLRSILERHLGDLRAEIYKTEKADMRNDLKHNEETIKELIARLGGA